VRAWIARHPFLLLGLSSLALFALAARLDVGLGLARILIVPWYAMWLLVTIVQVRLLGPDPGTPALGFAFLAVKIAAGFLPYLAADALLARVRQRGRRRPDLAT
jgi:hypothetical protein